MQQCRFDCLTWQFDGLRQRKRRWGCRHGGASQASDDADGAEIVGMLAGIRRRRRKLLLGRLDRRRGLRRDGVEMTKGKGELDRERKQRCPRSKPGISPHPLHRDDMPLAGSRTPVRSDVTT